MTKYSNIVLKWGMSADMELYDWHRQIVLGEVVRKNGSIIVLDRQGNEVARWNFVRAWPTKYDIPDFNASGQRGGDRDAGTGARRRRARRIARQLRGERLRSGKGVGGNRGDVPNRA